MSASNPEIDQATDGRRTTEQRIIEEIAQSRLNSAPYKVLGDVSCRFDNGQLTLSGHVPSFYHKQLAQSAVAEFVEQREDVHEVVNQIEVHQP